MKSFKSVTDEAKKYEDELDKINSQLLEIKIKLELIDSEIEDLNKKKNQIIYFLQNKDIKRIIKGEVSFTHDKNFYINLLKKLKTKKVSIHKRRIIKLIESNINEMLSLLEREEELLNDKDLCKQKRNELASFGSNIKKNTKYDMSYKNGKLYVDDDELLVSNTTESIQKVNIDQLYLVHTTDFFPKNGVILSNYDGKKQLPFYYTISDKLVFSSKYTSNRHTVHMTANCLAMSPTDGRGDLENKKYVLMDPFKEHSNEIISSLNGRPTNGDNYIESSVKLSSDAILITTDEYYDELSEEDKKSFNNVVICNGNMKNCVKHVLDLLKAPVYDMERNDAGHAHSIQYKLETILDQKDIVSEMLGKNRSFSDIEIALIFQRIKSELLSAKTFIKESVIDKMINELYITEDLAIFILFTGLYKVGNNHYEFSSYEDIKANLNNPDFYINSIKNSGTSLENIQSLIDNPNLLDIYQKDSNLKSRDILNTPISFVLNMKNWKILEQIINDLPLNENEIVIAREDGLYLTEKKDDYKHVNDNEICISKSEDTVESLIDRFNNVIKQNNKINA